MLVAQLLELPGLERQAAEQADAGQGHRHAVVSGLGPPNESSCRGLRKKPPRPSRRVRSHARVDTARAADLAPGDRERNRTMYAVLRYQPLASLQLGVEYLYWQTRYRDVGQGVANRFDLHLSVLF